MRSLWLEHPPPPAEPPARDLRCEALVIGAGLAGLSAAVHLERRGVDVRVVDAVGPGDGASGRNGGFVLITHPIEYPALRRRLGVDAARSLLGLARRTRALWTELGEGAARIEPAGSLAVTQAGDGAEAQALREAARCLAEDGVPCTLEPVHAALEGFGAQLRIPEDGAVHPGKLVGALAARLRWPVLLGRVAEVQPGRAVLADGQRITFSRAVVATNQAVPGLVPELRGVLRPERGQVLATAPAPARVLEPVVYATWGYDYLRQTAGRRFVLGGRRHRFVAAESTDAREVTADVQSALDEFLAHHVPAARGLPVTHRWAGIMGFTPDQLPVVGPRPEGPEEVWVLAGFTGHGLGLTGALGEALAAAWTASASAEQQRWLALLSPARFAAAP
ncbi:MAG: NAD(P)/FAD-dependent oxidoreductase [Sandaracinaceae bacterium]